ncbi:MAG: DUF72 domain-containing protein [Kofleriaceae bacterium]
MAEQLTLFGAPEPARGVVAAEPAAADVVELAARLPERLYLGTSSWSFPGWKGIVWRGEHSEQQLARKGLAAYAAHPLFRTVGIDRTHYAPVPAQTFRDYAAVVPASFRFLAKAHESCTLASFPSHPRYGTQRGAVNPLFLDAAYARDQVVAPFVEGLGAHAGPLLFQFAQQPLEQLGGSPRRFAEKLYRFLRDLPKGPLYCVELRNPQLLTDDYRAALRAAGAHHCVNALPQMPPPDCQPVAPESPLVIRWLLAPHHTYESALTAYRPFDRLLDPDLVTRRQLVTLLRDALTRDVPIWLIVNNKAEGSAPLTIRELARSLDEERSDDVPF